jgi:hypothetical protein
MARWKTLMFAAVVCGALLAPGIAEAQPVLTRGRTIHAANIVAGRWAASLTRPPFDGDWHGVPTKGSRCYRVNLRTFSCIVTIAGINDTDGNAATCDVPVRFYLFASGYLDSRRAGAGFCGDRDDEGTANRGSASPIPRRKAGRDTTRQPTLPARSAACIACSRCYRMGRIAIYRSGYESARSPVR